MAAESSYLLPPFFTSNTPPLPDVVLKALAGYALRLSASPDRMQGESLRLANEACDYGVPTVLYLPPFRIISSTSAARASLPLKQAGYSRSTRELGDSTSWPPKRGDTKL